MGVYNYKNYDEYVEKQTQANKEKITRVWADRHVMDSIVSWYTTHSGHRPAHILCHGTRTGAEQNYFLDNVPDAVVLGTEISDTAHMYENTIQWDFCKQRDEWVRKWDIVYSNSFDHSWPDPKQTLLTWKDQLSDNGMLVIDHTEWLEGDKADFSVDCNDISHDELVDLISHDGLKIVSVGRPPNGPDGKNMRIGSLDKVITRIYFALRRV